MDHGYPQSTDTKVLKEFIKTESNQLSTLSKDNTAKNNKLTESMTGKTCWRQEGIKYKIQTSTLCYDYNFLVQYF